MPHFDAAEDRRGLQVLKPERDSQGPCAVRTQHQRAAIRKCIGLDTGTMISLEGRAPVRAPEGRPLLGQLGILEL